MQNETNVATRAHFHFSRVSHWGLDNFEWHKGDTQWQQLSPLSSSGISSRLSPPQALCIHPLRCPYLRIIKYLLFLGRACLFSGVCFQRWFGPVRRLNSAVSDTPVFGLAAGDGGLAGSGGSECAGSVGCPPVAGQTAPVNLTTLRPFTLAAAHRIEYGLFGGQWQCQECWARVPPWEKTAFRSPSLSLPLPQLALFLAFGASEAVWWEEWLGALADQFPLFCRFHSGQSECVCLPEESLGESLASTSVFPDPVPHPHGYSRSSGGAAGHYIQNKYIWYKE